MTKPIRKAGVLDTEADFRTRREAVRRRLAEHGVIVQMPAEGEWVPPPGLLPVSADELSQAVILMRRGED